MDQYGELSGLAQGSLPFYPVFGRVRLTLVAEAAPELETTACRTPAIAARIIRPLLAEEAQEVVGALLLDCRHRPLGYTLPYRGTATKSLVEPRGLFVPALLTNSTALIAFHNHPSGDARPSREDRRVTRQLIEAGEILGIRVLDHLIIGKDPPFVSLREQGLWDSL